MAKTKRKTTIAQLHAEYDAARSQLAHEIWSCIRADSGAEIMRRTGYKIGRARRLKCEHPESWGRVQLDRLAEAYADRRL